MNCGIEGHVVLHGCLSSGDPSGVTCISFPFDFGVSAELRERTNSREAFVHLDGIDLPVRTVNTIVLFIFIKIFATLLHELSTFLTARPSAARAVRFGKCSESIEAPVEKVSVLLSCHSLLNRSNKICPLAPSSSRSTRKKPSHSLSYFHSF